MRFSILLLAALSAHAVELKLPREFEKPANLAMSAPPEFAASTLLRMVESGKITDRETEVVLLDQAFSLASQAHFRMAMRAAGNGSADTRSASLAKAYGLKLDSASLQSRAVLVMLPIDAARAREMFQSMVTPELPALTCQDALVYDVTAFYEALGAVARSGFSAKERARQDHVSLLLQYIAGVHSPVQIGPMIRALQQAGLTAPELSAAEVALSGQIESMSGDRRSYEATLSELNKAMPAELGASFKNYIAKNQSSDACKPSETQEEAYWQSAAAQKIMLGARKLRFGDATTRVLSDEDRSRSEWKQALADFEKDLQNLEPAAEKSDADYYQQKCIVYEALVELIPPGPERNSVLQQFFGFVNSSNLATQSPAEWFMPIAQMLERVRNANGGQADNVIAAMEASGNPALLVHAALAHLFDPGYPSWVAGGGSGR